MDKQVRSSLQEGGAFPLTVGQSHTMPIGPLSTGDLDRFMGGMRNRNPHHVSHQGAMQWCRWLPLGGVPPEGERIVHGGQVWACCEDALIGWLGEGTTVSAVQYNFAQPLFTSQSARLVATLLRLKKHSTLFEVTLETSVLLGTTDRLIGHSKGLELLVPRIVVFGQNE